MFALILLFAFVCGWIVRRFGYPPLIGYLAAGFIMSGMEIGERATLTPFADAGILLLLFTIGLKLNPAALTPRYVWGTALLHTVIAVPLTAAVIYVVGLVYAPLAFEAVGAAWALSFALSFSSTVFAIKIFEERGDAASIYATIAIGILVVQDVLAVAYLVISTGHYPSVWALGLLFLPLLRRPLGVWLRSLGHGELLQLGGVTIAFALAALCDLLQLKDSVGALLAGMLVAASARDKAKEIHERLAGLKNLLLIGFMVQIGYYGIPSFEMVLVALVLCLLIVLRPLIYFSLLSRFRLRVRTAWFGGLSLFTYSEFGLIVAAYAVEAGLLVPEWVTTLALAMSLTFVVATPFNQRAHALYRRIRDLLLRFEAPERLTEEAIGSLGGATTAILGMGRVGRGAYEALTEPGERRVVGVEENYAVTQRLLGEGYHCIHGDASDRDLWERTGLERCSTILVSLSHHRENLAVVQLAKEMAYGGRLVVAARFPDEKAQLEALGCHAYYLYHDVGRDFAQYAREKM